MIPPLAEATVSTSMLNLYHNCNYACKLRYVDKQTPVQINDTPLKIGKSGHKILEKFYEKLDLNTTDPEKEFKEKLTASAFQHWDRSIDSRKREEVESAFLSWLKFELDRYKLYKQNNKLDIFKPVEVEQDLTDYKNKMRAVIDKRCIGISGIKYVIDYKFDKKLPTLRNFKNILLEIDTKYKIQAAINTMVLKSYGYPIDAFYFQFVRYPDKLLSIPLNQQLFDEVNNLINKLRTDTIFEKNKKSCFFCNFKMYCNLKETSINCL
jgi:CRISPR/Cas system-associated exonuclease Cas4 (RecB family)